MRSSAFPVGAPVALPSSAMPFRAQWQESPPRILRKIVHRDQPELFDRRRQARAQ